MWAKAMPGGKCVGHQDEMYMTVHCPNTCDLCSKAEAAWKNGERPTQSTSLGASDPEPAAGGSGAAGGIKLCNDKDAGCAAFKTYMPVRGMHNAGAPRNDLLCRETSTSATVAAEDMSGTEVDSALELRSVCPARRASAVSGTRMRIT